MDRESAIKAIDDIREGLSHRDANTGLLVAIVRDLWDGYPLADAREAAKSLRLDDYAAERRIKAIVAALPASD